VTRPTRFAIRAERLDDRLVPTIHPLVTGTFAVAPASDSSRVQVYDPNGSLRFAFDAYDPGFTGGVFVATGDITGDRVADIVTSTGPGGSANVRVFDGRTGVLLSSFYAYPPEFTGGVNVALGDVDGDGLADIVCGVGVGGGPNVRIFRGQRLIQGFSPLGLIGSGGALQASFFAYDATFTGGVRVAVGDVNADTFNDIITGVGSGGGPNVRVLSGRQLSFGNTSLGPVSAGGALLSSFFALPEGFTGGVSVAAGDVNGDFRADILVGVGSGGGPNVRAFDGGTSAQLASFFAFDESLTGGVRVAGTDVNRDGFDDYVVGTGPGTGSLVRVISGRDGNPLLPEFAPFGTFTGGVNVG
jgi:hypothetical protein